MCGLIDLYWGEAWCTHNEKTNAQLWRRQVVSTPISVASGLSGLRCIEVRAGEKHRHDLLPASYSPKNIVVAYAAGGSGFS